MKRFLQKQAQTAGFSLVEALVAIAILLIAIVGPMTIAARGLQSAFFAREQMRASLLAQEGVELVRRIRDEDALARRLWLAGMGVCSNQHGCGIDARGITAKNCQTSAECRLYYDVAPLGSARGFYSHDSSGEATPFTRVIRVDPLSGNDEAEVSVAVSWESGLFGGEKSVLVRSRIFDQYDYRRP